MKPDQAPSLAERIAREVVIRIPIVVPKDATGFSKLVDYCTPVREAITAELAASPELASIRAALEGLLREYGNQPSSAPGPSELYVRGAAALASLTAITGEAK